MLLDGRSLPDGSTISTDVCIVGAGPAGLAIAREMIGERLTVHVLESGGVRRAAATKTLAQGENAGEPYWALDENRARCVGGTSALWGGWCRPLDELDMRRREWVPHSGWPIRHDELKAAYRRAHAVCEVEDPDYDLASWERSSGMRRLPLPERLAETRLYRLSPPTRFGSAYAGEMRAAGNVTLTTDATVTELVPADGAVARVRVACLTGTRFSVAARYVVLATGGIENARLLLASNAAEPAGLGNRRDLVGRFFMEHPHLPAGRVVLSRPFPAALYRPGRSAIARLFLPDAVQEREGLLHSNVMLVPTGPALMPRAPGARLHRIWRRPRAFTLQHTLEQAPDPSSRVELSARRDALGQPLARLRWRTGHAERWTLERSGALIGEAFERAGLARFEPAPPSDGDWPCLQGRLGHHMGTTRMDPDPRRGVVDTDCRVHGVRNLFVAGGSVFPTAGAGTPTITILALALRLADHIRALAR